MEIFKDYSGNIKGAALIPGFFDGIHLGHRKVISSAVNCAKENGAKTVMLTFPKSPAEYFGDKSKNNAEYIYPRHYSYELADTLGVDYIIENNLEKLSSINAEDYLEYIIKTFAPISISTGTNHTFGANKKGDEFLLKNNEKKYGYKYFCLSEKYNGEIISSTKIKKLITSGEIELANKLLGEPYTLEGIVNKGMQLGRQLGFPTANSNYTENIVKLPYGVYKAEALGRPAVLNWGIKPTVNGQKEGLETHIIGYDGDLYGKILQVKILAKIRNEQKFNSIEDLKAQIEKDTQLCLKL